MNHVLQDVCRFIVIGIVCLWVAACEPIIWNDLVYGDITGEIWEGSNPNKIRITCTNGCTTLAYVPESPTELTRVQQQKIRQFLKRQARAKPVYVSPCDNWVMRVNPNAKIIYLIIREINKLGYKTALVRPVFPYPTAKQEMCVNLLRGKLQIIPPRCPNLRTRERVYRISSDFGCSTNHNLSAMVADPWDLITLPGDSSTRATRISRGNMNYNDGIKADLKTQPGERIFQ